MARTFGCRSSAPAALISRSLSRLPSSSSPQHKLLFVRDSAVPVLFCDEHDGREVFVVQQRGRDVEEDDEVVVVVDWMDSLE